MSVNNSTDGKTATIATAMAMISAAATAYVIGIYAGFEVSTRVWIGIASFFVYSVMYVFLIVWLRHWLIWKKIKSGNCSPDERERLLDIVTSGAIGRIKETPEYRVVEAKAMREREVYLDPLLEKIEKRIDNGGKSLSETDKRYIDADLKELEKRLQWLNKK